MQAPSFKQRFARLPALNQPQRLQTLAALHPAARLDRIIALIDEVRAPALLAELPGLAQGARRRTDHFCRTIAAYRHQGHP